jgi:hypothetical protein
MNNITCFEDLLTAARAQPIPQTLLMVFVDVELPLDASAQERADFERGEGGNLTPRMCLDRESRELTDWPSLAAEADQQSPDWRMVMVAALSASSNDTSDSQTIEQHLDRMVMAIHQGQIQSFVPLDRQGQALHFS